MSRWQWAACAAFSAMCLAICAVPTDVWALFFTHPLLAQRAGVQVREVTVQGAQLLRISAGVLAVAWVLLPLVMCRALGGARASRGDQWASQSAAPTSGGIISARTGPWSLVVTAAILAGVLERLVRLGESFWFDEIAALIDYAQYGAGAIMGTYFTSANHVLSTVLNWMTIEAFGGVTEPALRAPAFLAGIASIWAVMLLAREVARWSPRTPWQMVGIATIAAALCPIMVLESVEARGYSLMVLFSALSSTLLLRAVRESSTGSLLGYSITSALGIWSHLVFAVLPISHALVAAFFLSRKQSRGGALAAIAASALSGVTAFVLLSPLLPDLLRIRSDFLALDGNEPTLVSREGLHCLLGIGGAWSWAALPALVLACIGLMGAVDDRGRRVPLLVTLAGLPVLVAATWGLGSWMYARFALFALPGALLAMSLGACDLLTLANGPGGSRRILKTIALTLAVATAIAWSASLWILPPKQPIRDAVAFVRENTTADALIASAGLPDNVVAYYGLLAERAIANAGSGGKDLDSLTPPPQWLIVIYPRSLMASASDELARDWTLEREFPGWVDWDNGNVLVFRRRD